MPIATYQDLEPINLIKSVVIGDSPSHNQQFVNSIKHLYQYPQFKIILDLTASKIIEKKLQFRVFNEVYFKLDAGNCQTIEGGKFNKFLNRFVKDRTYIITLRRPSPDIIVHELAHMLEKESDHKLGIDFATACTLDLKNHPDNIALNKAVNDLLFEGLRSYHQSQYSSEYLARYFEILSLSYEIAGKANKYGFKLDDAESYFVNTKIYIEKFIYPKIFTKIDDRISKISASYQKKPDEIQHQWSTQKVQAKHQEKKSPQWSKVIRSIKEDTH